MRRTRGLLLAWMVVLWPGGVAAQAPGDSAAAGRAQLFARDFRTGFGLTLATLAAPEHWSRGEWVAVPAVGIALVTLSGVDDPVHGAIDRNRTRGEDRVLSAIEPLGSKGGIATVVGTYLVGLAVGSPGLRRAGVEAAASSVVASGLVTPGLKLLVGRSRPWARRGPFDFHSLSGNESFPSGHTTQAFAAASVFAAEAHPFWAKAGIYGLAGGVAAARLVHDAHFLSDVAAGALIGTVTGRAVVHRERRPGGLAPYVGGGGVGLELRF